MGGLTGPAPDRDQAVQHAIDVPYRRSQLALAAAFVMLVGAVVAFTLHGRTIGIVLLVLMLLCGMASFFFSVMFRNRAMAQARQARREQAARVTARRPSSRPEQDLSVLTVRSRPVSPWPAPGPSPCRRRLPGRTGAVPPGGVREDGAVPSVGHLTASARPAGVFSGPSRNVPST